tara:strand:+ start:58562 stop:59731 length:1170 start_codon:yes stop_codon:yes gene_type:complete
MILTKKDIKRHPDSSSTLFYHKEKLYRGLQSRELQFLDAISSCKYTQPYSKTDIKLRWGKELRTVIEHPIIEHLIKIQELTCKQSLKIVVGLCEMNVELLKKGIVLFDIHEGNIAYSRGEFVWLDYNAVAEIDSNYASYSFVKLAYIINSYVFKKDVQGGYSKYNGKSVNGHGGWLANHHKRYKGNCQSKEFWDELLTWVKTIKLPQKKNHWYNNYSNIMDVKHPEKVNPKAKIVSDLLDELEYKTVTDVACNKGYYTFLAIDKQQGGVESAVGFDYVEPCIDDADGFDKSLPATFVYSDIERLIRNEYREIERYSSELVIALAIVHHITFKHEIFAKLLANLTKKFLILEDINTAEVYEKALIKHGLELVKRISSYPGGRKLSLYRVK